jgi:hypothetical protein
MSSAESPVPSAMCSGGRPSFFKFRAISRFSSSLPSSYLALGRVPAYYADSQAQAQTQSNVRLAHMDSGTALDLFNEPVGYLPGAFAVKAERTPGGFPALAQS